MERELARILAELEEFGEANDRAAADRGHKMLNITHDTGVLLTLLLRNGRCREVLEVGTSNGYSTLWLAHAVGPAAASPPWNTPRTSGRWPRRTSGARTRPRIRQVAGEAGEFLASCGAGAFDFVFLDSDRGQYADWWPALQRILAPGCLLVVDNAVSHAHELKDFVQRVEASEGYLSSLLPVGKGEFVVLKAT